MTARFIRPIALMIALTAMLICCPAVRAEEYPLPAAAELSAYPPAAVRFYLDGVQQLDRINYEAAYDSLAKAAQLAPDGVRLNMIVAALGMKHGRSYRADIARDFYETAVYSYQNVLRQPEIDEDFRREVQNRLKVAMDERDNLAQRDARREGIGGQFIIEFNREVAKESEEAPPAAPEAPAAPVAAATPAAAPAVGTYPQYPAAQPAYPSGLPGAQPGYPAFPGAAQPAYPSFPGAQPAYPAFPGAPAAPAAPGAPAAPFDTGGAAAPAV